MATVQRIDTKIAGKANPTGTTLKDAVKTFVWEMVKSGYNTVEVERCANGVSVSVKTPQSRDNSVWLFSE